MNVIFWIVVIVALIIIGPLLTIWALNTLFPVLAIEYSVWSWLAVVIIGGFFKANVKVNK
jgi:hypothetical protein